MARENPLDCAIYLSRGTNSIFTPELAGALFAAKRFDQAIQQINLKPEPFDRFTRHAEFTKKAIEAGDAQTATKFLAEAMVALRENNWWGMTVREFIFDLIVWGHEAEAQEILSYTSDWSKDDQISGLQNATAAYAKLGRHDAAGTYLQAASKLGEWEKAPASNVTLAQFYVRLGERESALEAMKRAEAQLSTLNDALSRDLVLMELIRLNVKLGREEESPRLWGFVDGRTDFTQTRAFADVLRENGKLAEARALIDGLAADRKIVAKNGFQLSLAYLDLNDPVTGLRIARGLSDRDDDPGQQLAFMNVADKFIALGDRAAAFATLELALQKARRASETSRDGHVSPDSPLGRKLSFLRAIVERYLRLRAWDRAIAIGNSVKSRDPSSNNFRAECFLKIAEQPKGSPARPAIDGLLERALAALSENSEESYLRRKLQISFARIYAERGDRQKVLGLLTDAIRSARNERLLSDILLSAGVVFENNGLKAGPELRSILEELVDSQNGQRPINTRLQPTRASTPRAH